MGDLHPTKHSTAGWYHMAVAAVYGIIVVVWVEGLRRAQSGRHGGVAQVGASTILTARGMPVASAECATSDGWSTDTPPTRSHSRTRRDGNGTSELSGESPRPSSTRSSRGKAVAARFAVEKGKTSKGSVLTTATQPVSDGESFAMDAMGASAGSSSTDWTGLQLILGTVRACMYAVAIWWHFSGALNHFKEHRRQRS
jgi:hypothetical protein